jgi:hypothetical protein
MLNPWEFVPLNVVVGATAEDFLRARVILPEESVSRGIRRLNFVVVNGAPEEAGVAVHPKTWVAQVWGTSSAVNAGKAHRVKPAAADREIEPENSMELSGLTSAKANWPSCRTMRAP